MNRRWVFSLFFLSFFLFFLETAFADSAWKKVETDIGAGWKGLSFFVSDNGRRLGLQSGGKIVWKQPMDSAWKGEICGRPVLARSNDPAHPWIVVVGNGWKSKNGMACVAVLDMADGSLLARFSAGQEKKNGICSLTLVDLDGDGRVDCGYAGDLRGNLWKFFLKGQRSNWRLVSPDPLFTATFEGRRQPITAAPNIFKHCTRSGVLVSFGTGRLLDKNDKKDTSRQSLYTVWDSGTWSLGTFDAATGQFSRLAGSFFGMPVTLLAQRLENRDERYRTGSSFFPVWWEKKTEGISHVGWYVNLPGIDGRFGERITDKVLIRTGTLFAVSFLPALGTYPGGSIVMSLRACSGSVLSRPAFDINLDGNIDQDDCIDGKPMAGKKEIGVLQRITFTEKDEKPAVRMIGEFLEKTVRIDSCSEGIFFWQQLEEN